MIWRLLPVLTVLVPSHQGANIYNHVFLTLASKFTVTFFDEFTPYTTYCLDKWAGQPVPRLRGCGAAQASHLQEPGRWLRQQHSGTWTSYLKGLSRETDTGWKSCHYVYFPSDSSGYRAKTTLHWSPSFHMTVHIALLLPRLLQFIHV